MTVTHPKGNAEYINRLNKIKVLNLIRESDKISRAEIVKTTGLSAPTVTRIVDSLINVEKLAVQVGVGESKGGRPPVIVKFNGADGYVIGIDWGRTHIYGVLSNLNGEILVKKDIATDAADDFDKDLAIVVTLVEALIAKSGVSLDNIYGIGLAASGFINRHSGLVEYSPNFNWKNVDIKKPLVDRFKVPVIVDNVSRVMAQGELLYGAGENCKDFIFVNVGYGIGSGVIINGQPFYGFDGLAGEIGHNRIIGSVAAGKVCNCGKLDCLECYSSGRGISATAQEQIQFYSDSSLAKYDTIDTQIIAEEAANDDSFCKEIMSQAAEYLGIAIASMANVFNPEAIVLGGKVMRKDGFYTEKVKRVFQRETLQQSNRKIKITESVLKDEAAVLGAVSLVLQEVLNFREPQ
ncbi:ROK family transcriptional regulator [Saccharicrinis aurantiacus]|uniref:ROK family transcriptional regulator n=1 Tax=Saccharicrinis aurantiacus TaxID=1849719 RepID=UPI00094F9FAE|nr:ROK family transcriptional regulator [Saccharicrinis aurantiacus]